MAPTWGSDRLKHLMQMAAKAKQDRDLEVAGLGPQKFFLGIN
jgi:hypothetical protein